VAVRSKVYFCGRSIAGIAGSNPVMFLCRYRPPLRADPSSGGVLPGECDLETCTMRRPGPDLGCCAIGRGAGDMYVDAINNNIDRLVDRCKCFGGICCLLLQVRCMNMENNLI